MQSDFLVFGAPKIEEAEIEEVIACLRSGWIGTGPRVARFETDFAAYLGTSGAHVAAVNSCTAALHVSMVAAGLDPGAEVITTPLTFCATVNAIVHSGLTPVLADVDPVTQCIDPDAIEAAITPRTQAILPVHFAGRPCDMERIMAIADKHKLIVIEDCAHAIETEFHGRKAGTFGNFGCFSFYVTKNVATGEGGMIIGRSEAHIARARMLAAAARIDEFPLRRLAGFARLACTAVNAGRCHLARCTIGACLGVQTTAPAALTWRTDFLRSARVDQQCLRA